MSKYFYAKKRRIRNKITNNVRECYSAVIIDNGTEYTVADNGEILEFDNKEDALTEAKDCYLRFVAKNN